MPLKQTLTDASSRLFKTLQPLGDKFAFGFLAAADWVWKIFQKREVRSADSKRAEEELAKSQQNVKTSQQDNDAERLRDEKAQKMLLKQQKRDAKRDAKLAKEGKNLKTADELRTIETRKKAEQDALNTA